MKLGLLGPFAIVQKTFKRQLSRTTTSATSHKEPSTTTLLFVNAFFSTSFSFLLALALVLSANQFSSYLTCLTVADKNLSTKLCNSSVCMSIYVSVYDNAVSLKSHDALFLKNPDKTFITMTPLRKEECNTEERSNDLTISTS